MYTHSVYTMMIDAEVKQWGNSYGIRIPKGLAEDLDIGLGDKVSLTVVKKAYRVEDFFGSWKGGKPFVREYDDRY